MHVTVLGIELTLPAPPARDDRASEQEKPTYLVAAPPSVDLEHTSGHFVTADMTGLPTGEPVAITCNFRCKTACAAPLSDNARHERSGVQLI
jgi:hypothetical protein